MTTAFDWPYSNVAWRIGNRSFVREPDVSAAGAAATVVVAAAASLTPSRLIAVMVDVLADDQAGVFAWVRVLGSVKTDGAGNPASLEVATGAFGEIIRRAGGSLATAGMSIAANALRVDCASGTAGTRWTVCPTFLVAGA